MSDIDGQRELINGLMKLTQLLNSDEQIDLLIRAAVKLSSQEMRIAQLEAEIKKEGV